MGGNRWIGVHHAASAQHFPGALARHGFKCLNASILISVLEFQFFKFLHLFPQLGHEVPVHAESKNAQSMHCNWQ